MYTCTFFGHRDCPESIKPLLSREIERLICEKGVTDFLVGDSGSFDYLVRRVLMEMENRYAIRYSVVLAYLPDEKKEPTFDAAHHILPDGFEKVPPRFAIDHRNRYSRKGLNTNRPQGDFSAQILSRRLPYTSMAALRDRIFAQKFPLVDCLQVKNRNFFLWQGDRAQKYCMYFK